MKLKLNAVQPARCIYQVSNCISKHMENNLENMELSMMCIQNRQNCNKLRFLHKTELMLGNTLRSTYSGVPKHWIWRIYPDLWGPECKKITYIWLYSWSKYSIAKEVKLDVLCHLPNVHTKFEIHISQSMLKEFGRHRWLNGWTNIAMA